MQSFAEWFCLQEQCWLKEQQRQLVTECLLCLEDVEVAFTLTTKNMLCNMCRSTTTW
jgi:hypothetical protein